MKKLWALITLLVSAGVLYTSCPNPAGGKPPVVNPKVPGEFTIDNYDVTVSLDDGVKLDLDAFNKIKDIFEKVNEDLSDEALAGFDDLIAGGLTVKISANGTLTINIADKIITIPFDAINDDLAVALADAINNEFQPDSIPESFRLGSNRVTVSFGADIVPDLVTFRQIRAAFKTIYTGQAEGLDADGKAGLEGLAGEGLTVQVSKDGTLTIDAEGKKVIVPLSAINANLGKALSKMLNDEFYVEPIPGSFKLNGNTVTVSFDEDVKLDLATFNQIKAIFEGLNKNLEDYGQASFATMIDGGLTVHLSADGSLAIDVDGKKITIPVDAINEGFGAVLAAALNDEFYVEPIPESFKLGANRVTVSFGAGIEPDLATFRQIRAAFKTIYTGQAGDLSADGKAGLKDLAGEGLKVQISASGTLTIDVDGKTITIPVSAIKSGLGDVLSTMLNDEFYVEPVPESFLVDGKSITVSFGTGLEPDWDTFNQIKAVFEGLSGDLNADGQAGLDDLIGAGLTVKISANGSLTINVSSKRIIIPANDINEGLGAALASAINAEFFPESFMIDGKSVAVSFGTGVEPDWNTFNKIKAVFEGLNDDLSSYGKTGLGSMMGGDGMTVDISKDGSLTINVSGKTITIPVSTINVNLGTVLADLLNTEFFPESFMVNGKSIAVSFGTGLEKDLATFNQVKAVFEGLDANLSSYAKTGLGNMMGGAGLAVEISKSGSLAINVSGKKITIPASKVDTNLGAALSSALNTEFFPESFLVGTKNVVVSFGTGVEQDLATFNKIKAAFEGLGEDLSDDGQDGFDGLIAAGLTVQVSANGSLTINVSGKKITIPVSAINANLGTVLASALNDEFYIEPVPGSFLVGTKTVTVSFGTGVEPDWDLFNTIKTAFTGLGSSLSAEGSVGLENMMNGAGLAVQVAKNGTLTIDVDGKTITIPVGSIGTGLSSALVSVLDDEFYVEPVPDSFKVGTKNVLILTGTGVAMDWDMFNAIKGAFTGLSGNLSVLGQEGFDAMIAAGLSVHLLETGTLAIDVSGKKITIPVGSIGTGLGTALTTALDDEFYVAPKEGIMKRIEVPTFGGAIQDESGNPYGLRFRFIDGIEDENIIIQILAKFEAAWSTGALTNANIGIRKAVYNRVLARGIKIRIENPESHYDFENPIDYKTIAWHLDYIMIATANDLSMDLDYCIMNEINEMEPPVGGRVTVTKKA